MKPTISMGLMLLLASCAAPVNQSGTHASTAHARHNETLRPKLVAVSPAAPERTSHALPGIHRNYGEVELPPPVASINAPPTRYQPPAAPRRVINNVSNGPLQGTEAEPPASVDVTPTGAYRTVINQITNQPLRSGEAAYEDAVGTRSGIINEVTNKPSSGTPPPVPVDAMRAGLTRTVISPITNTPVQ